MTDNPKRTDRLVWRAGDLVPLAAEKSPVARKADSLAEANAVIPLAAIRRARGATQKQMAERMAVDQAQVSRLETRPDFRVSTLLGYLGALEVSEVDLQLRFADGTEMTIELGEA